MERQRMHPEIAKLRALTYQVGEQLLSLRSELTRLEWLIADLEGEADGQANERAAVDLRIHFVNAGGGFKKKRARAIQPHGRARNGK